MATRTLTYQSAWTNYLHRSIVVELVQYNNSHIPKLLQIEKRPLRPGILDLKVYVSEVGLHFRKSASTK